jgi:hypothetical protein
MKHSSLSITFISLNKNKSRSDRCKLYLEISASQPRIHQEEKKKPDEWKRETTCFI